jgi:hypothetical protein
MRAWVVYATRKLPTAPGKKPLCELRIVQVPVAHLAPLALALNAKSVNEPSWFLTADGAAIINTLSSIGVVPLHCRVKFLKRSMDRVYLLNLPVAAFGGPFKVLSGHDDASLALKVVGGGRFVQEADALRRIAVSAKVPGFYALGAARTLVNHRVVRGDPYRGIVFGAREHGEFGGLLVEQGLRFQCGSHHYASCQFFAANTIRQGRRRGWCKAHAACGA